MYEAALAKRREYGAAIATVEALMFCIREQGVSGLDSAQNQRRLGELSPDQLSELISRLMALRPKYPAITDELLIRLSEKMS
jgi:hypothetical protein